MTKYHIFIDGSYFTFFRFHALINWWKLSHKDEPCVDLHLNEEFIEKFSSIFIKKLREIPKLVGLHKDKSAEFEFYIGKDCPQETIWRKKLYAEYKGNRPNYNEADNKPGPFFKLAYNEPTSLFQTALPNAKFINHEHLEADDCIAIYSREILETEPYDEVIIITSDMDYLQLIQQRVHIYDLKGKNLAQKMNFDCPKKELLYKIIVGDKSDNIPSVFPKCGKITAKKYCDNIELFQFKLEEKTEYMNNYKHNKTLIDFNEIPLELKGSFISRYFE